jgi:hypothetical protein
MLITMERLDEEIPLKKYHGIYFTMVLCYNVYADVKSLGRT